MCSNSHIKSYFAPFQAKNWPKLDNRQKWSVIEHFLKWLSPHSCIKLYFGPFHPIYLMYCKHLVLHFKYMFYFGVEMIPTKSYCKKCPFLPIFHILGVMTTRTPLLKPNIFWISYLTLHFYTLFRGRDLKNKKLLWEICIFTHFSIFNSPPPIWPELPARFFSKMGRFMPHSITCLYARNNMTVTCKTWVINQNMDF